MAKNHQKKIKGSPIHANLASFNFCSDTWKNNSTFAFAQVGEV